MFESQKHWAARLLCLLTALCVIVSVDVARAAELKLNAAALQNPLRVELSWIATEVGGDGFEIYRAPGVGQSFARIGQVTGDTTSFVDEMPPEGGAVYMVVGAPAPKAKMMAAASLAPAGFDTTSFVTTDTLTGGNWTARYGAEGNWISGSAPTIPWYLTVTPVKASPWIWRDLSLDAAAIPLPGTTRRAAVCWNSATAFHFDIAVKDSQSHRISAYFVDWDMIGRQQRVELLDGTTGAILDSRVLSNFGSGVYVTWDIAADVRLRVTPLVGSAVLSAFYFDVPPPTVVAPAPDRANNVRFVKTDVTTLGNWPGVYGQDGSIISRDSARQASYASVTVSQQSEYTYAAVTTDVRALINNAGAGRIAGVWYSYYPTTNAFYIDVNITDGAAHQVAIYALDWTRAGRALVIDALDAEDGTTLDTRPLQSYGDGKYLVWDVKGRVRFRVSTTAGPNASISGVFLGPPSAPL